MKPMPAKMTFQGIQETSRSWALAGLVAMIAAAAIAGTGCGNKAAPGDKANSAAGGDSLAQTGKDTTTVPAKNKPKKKTKEKSITVNACKVVRGELVIPVVAEGAIRARHATQILSVIAGRLDRILVKEGQTVRKGQLIARLDDREYRVALQEARSKYLEALGRLAADDETLDSVKAADWLKQQITELDRLETERTITRKERMDRELALEVEAVKQGAYRNDLVKVRSGLAAARADQERAELNLENTEIRAPFAGVISTLTLTSGERVTANQKICNLVDNLNLEADVAVLESDLAGLEAGRQAILELPALGKTLDVQVDVMSPEIDPDSRTCQLLLRFQNTGGDIRPGMFVRASIAGETYPDRLLVPREAILTRDGRPLLFKIVNKRAEWVYITPGLSNDRLMEVEKILQGGPLEPGTPVVISDHLTLTHQAKVKVRRMEEITFAFAPKQDR